MHSACFNRRAHTGCGHAHLLHAASIFCFNPRTTQGATFWVVPCIVIMLVSIHAHRVRLPSLTRKIQTFVVSIHAPTQGATEACKGSILFPYFVSIHAPTQGATTRRLNYLRDPKFQSTHPHGVRPDKNVAEGIKAQFQSTHPHGVRPANASTLGVSVDVSIHAPTRGATYFCRRVCSLI